MRLLVETVLVRQGESVGWGFGRSETDPGIVFVFGGDVRVMVGLGEAMAAAGEVWVSSSCTTRPSMALMRAVMSSSARACVPVWRRSAASCHRRRHEVVAGDVRQMLEVGLGRDEVEVMPENAVVKAPGTGFDATYIKSVKGEPEVLVNVYSARKTHENNLLSCGIYQGPISMAQKKPVDIQCDLIDGLNDDGDVVVETGTPGQ